MTSTQFAALLGFLFIAVWAGEGFGSAIACLLGALVAYGVAAFLRGELDVGELQGRLSAARQDITGSSGSTAQAGTAGRRTR